MAAVLQTQPSTNKSDENPNKLKDGIDMLDIFLILTESQRNVLVFGNSDISSFFF